eukprot:309410-Chlamydomonas_euryale.AAC.10
MFHGAARGVPPVEERCTGIAATADAAAKCDPTHFPAAGCSPTRPRKRAVVHVTAAGCSHTRPRKCAEVQHVVQRADSMHAAERNGPWHVPAGLDHATNCATRRDPDCATHLRGVGIDRHHGPARGLLLPRHALLQV